jgi:predicted kinase
MKLSHLDLLSARKLILLVGLPRSGKTTWAKRHQKAHGWPVVNPDAIRVATHGDPFNPLTEKLVWAMAEIQVRAHFAYGHDTVILDAPNTTRAQRDSWRSAAYARFFHHLATPAHICIARAADAGNHELMRVIRNMAATFEPLGDDEEILL